MDESIPVVAIVGAGSLEQLANVATNKIATLLIVSSNTGIKPNREAVSA